MTCVSSSLIEGHTEYSLACMLFLQAAGLCTRIIWMQATLLSTDSHMSQVCNDTVGLSCSIRMTPERTVRLKHQRILEYHWLEYVNCTVGMCLSQTESKSLHLISLWEILNSLGFWDKINLALYN